MTSANPRAFLPARKGAGPQGQGPGSQDAGDFQQGLGVGVPLWAPGVEVAEVVDVATSSSTSREFSSGDKQAIRSGRTAISGGQQSGAGSNELQAPGIGRTRAPGFYSTPCSAEQCSCDRWLRHSACSSGTRRSIRRRWISRTSLAWVGPVVSSPRLRSIRKRSPQDGQSEKQRSLFGPKHSRHGQRGILCDNRRTLRRLASRCHANGLSPSGETAMRK